MAAVKCRKHPNFTGLRAPKRSKNNPEGCPVCWEFYRQHRHDLAEADRPKTTRSPRAVQAQKNLLNPAKINKDKLRVETDEVTGEHAIVYGRRAIYTATTMDEIHAFMAGFREGMSFEGREDVGGL